MYHESWKPELLANMTNCNILARKWVRLQGKTADHPAAFFLHNNEPE
jgi:hypothetical protein